MPFRRSAKLSNDHAGTLPVIQDAIQRLEEDGSSIEMVSCIYPTVPLLSGKTLRRAGKDFLSNSGCFLIAATSFDYPVQRGFFFSKDEQSNCYKLRRIKILFINNSSVFDGDI